MQGVIMHEMAARWARTLTELPTSPETSSPDAPIAPNHPLDTGIGPNQIRVQENRARSRARGPRPSGKSRCHVRRGAFMVHMSAPYSWLPWLILVGGTARTPRGASVEAFRRLPQFRWAIEAIRCSRTMAVGTPGSWDSAPLIPCLLSSDSLPMDGSRPGVSGARRDPLGIGWTGQSDSAPPSGSAADSSAFTGRSIPTSTRSTCVSVSLCTEIRGTGRAILSGSEKVSFLDR